MESLNVWGEVLSWDEDLPAQILYVWAEENVSVLMDFSGPKRIDPLDRRFGRCRRFSPGSTWVKSELLVELFADKIPLRLEDLKSFGVQFVGAFGAGVILQPQSTELFGRGAGGRSSTD
jgi:hypothetical protein